MIRALQLRELVVRPVLIHLGMHSAAAENLMMGTAAVESQLGHYLAQVGGPALGIWQCEPATHDDVHGNFLKFRPELTHKLQQWAVSFAAEEMIWNLAYSCAIARLVYRRAPAPLPAADDLGGLAAYWKQHYNSHLGAGTELKFRQAYALTR